MDINQLVKDVLERRASILEDFAKAFVAETGLMPSEVELCEEHRPSEIVFYFRKKTDPHATPEWEPHL